jgi:hypothetical protein
MIVDKETALDKWKANERKTIMRDKKEDTECVRPMTSAELAEINRKHGQLQSPNIEFSILEDSTKVNVDVEAARRLQRARETYNTPLGMRQKLDLTNIEESILKMLMDHEDLLRRRDAENFRFLLPNPADINRINENGTLEYKRGWKAGAQYLINLNKGLR